VSLLGCNELSLMHDQVQINAKGMFVSPVMVKAFTSLFFNGDRGNFGTNSLTKHMFSPITPEAIKMVGTMVRHCIEEYKHGARVAINFEGQYIEGMYSNLLAVDVRTLTRCQ